MFLTSVTRFTLLDQKINTDFRTKYTGAAEKRAIINHNNPFLCRILYIQNINKNYEVGIIGIDV